jgi:hypothetical protein
LPAFARAVSTLVLVVSPSDLHVGPPTLPLGLQTTHNPGVCLS